MPPSFASSRALAEHKAIADALERGDSALVRVLVTVNISGVELARAGA